ncbi:MAG: hypothetical protein QM820_04670 [Minicystis sp.]
MGALDEDASSVRLVSVAFVETFELLGCRADNHDVFVIGASPAAAGNAGFSGLVGDFGCLLLE